MTPSLIPASEARKPFNVTCGKCHHVWPALYTPMEMGAAATVLKNMRCPMCGVPSKHIFMAPSLGKTR